VRSKAQQLNILRDDIVRAGVCLDLATQANQLVMGAGNPDADIVFIGEAPGKKEDQTGLPFVGASGRFLNSMLEAAGLKREGVYITNIVKYRPPDNRDPSRAEKDQFWPYLMQQLKIIQPRVVITLGRHSGTCFIPDLVISRDHGNAQVVGDWLVVPLYHPAAALYNGSMRQVLIDDFLAAANLAKSS
jgi:DNA polymerase